MRSRGISGAKRCGKVAGEPAKKFIYDHDVAKFGLRNYVSDYNRSKSCLEICQLHGCEKLLVVNSDCFVSSIWFTLSVYFQALKNYFPFPDLTTETASHYVNNAA